MSTSSIFFKKGSKDIFTPSQIRDYMADIKNHMNLHKNVAIGKMVEVLEASKKLKKIELPFPNKKFTRYTWGKKSIYEILLTIDLKAYYSHLSALYFHDLLEQDTDEIYLNVEQKPKPRYSNIMAQEDIYKAFSRPPRITNNRISYQQRKIYFLNGMFTGDMGVIDILSQRGEKIRTTDIERTLIDITVRPHYSGGVSNVFNIYKKVIEKVSIRKIINMLKKLNYSYPYHQSIGFYMESAGFMRASNILIKEFGLNHDFFLANQMHERKYSQKWRLYYPLDML
jgi:predicted transcriptional regulator of viral defense system